MEHKGFEIAVRPEYVVVGDDPMGPVTSAKTSIDAGDKRTHDAFAPRRDSGESE